MDRALDRLPRGLVGFAIAETFGFGLPFLLGLLAGVATPGGWEPWRLGALIAAIIGGIATIVFTVLLIVYLTE